MSVKVRIPGPLRRLTGGQEEVELSAATVGDCLNSLHEQFPAMKERLFDEMGEVRRFINIYVNGEDVSFLEGLATLVKPGDEISIVPAVAGG